MKQFSVTELITVCAFTFLAGVAPFFIMASNLKDGDEIEKGTAAVASAALVGAIVTVYKIYKGKE